MSDPTVNNKPITKLNVGVPGGSALSLVLLAVARWAGVEVSADEAAAFAIVLTSLCTYAVAYFTPDKRVVGSSHPEAPAART